MPTGHSSLKGQLLLDGGKLSRSYFHRTVVLICEHNAEGAFGLVLNRPSEAKLADTLGRELPETIRADALFGGGPVQPAALSYLHADAFLLGPNVLPNLTLGHDLEALIEIGQGWSPTKQLRVFAGYAGWSPGQLDEEMRREAWLVQPATTELVFHTPPEDLWRHILRVRNRWPERLLADAPEDFAAN
jgi:putative transcriptional regulator